MLPNWASLRSKRVVAKEIKCAKALLLCSNPISTPKKRSKSLRGVSMLIKACFNRMTRKFRPSNLLRLKWRNK